jgi:hypothetical protein
MPKTDQPSTTRRALFAAAPAVALTAPAAATALPAPSTALAMWREHRAISKRVNTFEDVGDIALERMFALEDRILAAPINSMEGALAVLCAVGLTTERGERTDGSDEEAYQRVLAWMDER